MSVQVRLMRPEDALQMAELAEQLGYPSTLDEMADRLQAVQGHRDHAVYVAEGEDGGVVGWIQVGLCRWVIADRQAEIGGVVVDQAHRSQGIGRLLVQAAQRWAQGQGAATLVVRSNVVRQGAHAFYTRLGFQEVKIQRVFSKRLEGGEPLPLD